MQRRLLKFILLHIGKEVRVTLKNGQFATGILHAFDTDKMDFILKNYCGYD
jgi:small nuclear ribonucleoprotein (snRNP)-like protein